MFPCQINGMAIFVQPFWGFPDPTDLKIMVLSNRMGRDVVYLVFRHCALPLLLWIRFGSMAQFITWCAYLCETACYCHCGPISTWYRSMLIDFWSHFLSLSVSDVSIPKYYWSDPTPKVENLGRAELEIYRCKRFSGGTLLLRWDTWRYPGGMSAICSPQPTKISWFTFACSIHNLADAFVLCC